MNYRVACKYHNQNGHKCENLERIKTLKGLIKLIHWFFGYPCQIKPLYFDQCEFKSVKATSKPIPARSRV